MMKTLTTSLVASLAVLGTALAGETTAKSYKATTTVAPETCFSDHELQIDTFGQASFGDNSKIGVFRDTAWGGGVGLNYFFQRNIGLGIEGAWLSAKHSGLGHDLANSRDDRTVIHNLTGSIILRLPLDSVCVAPYVYVGGGWQDDGSSWASGHVGAGLEYRIVPHKVGIFVDGRWTYLGDRFQESDLNFWSVRAGFRLVF